MFRSLLLIAGRRIAAALRHRSIPLRLLVWILAAVASLPYVWLRGVADNAGMPREQVVLAAEKMIGVGRPLSERLQGWFYSGTMQPFDWLMAIVYTSWFFAPEIIAIYIVVRRWDLFPQFAFVRLGILYTGLVGFFLLPTEPPWMVAQVVRILEAANGEPLRLDTNAVAALPSLHVAVPAGITMWLWTARLRWWALLFTIFTGLEIFAVVYLGEHYLIDAAAGVALAYVVVRLVSRFVPRWPAPEKGDSVAQSRV